MSAIIVRSTGHTEIVRGTRVSRIGAVAGIVILLALVTMPWWGERSDMRSVVEFLYVLALAEMWNLMAGFGGLVSIGQQGFIGIGGYALVLLAMKLGVNPFVAVPLCGLIAALIAVPTAALVFRLRGAYFAVGTWVVSEVFRLAIANIIWLGAGTGTSLTSAMMGTGAWLRDSLALWIAIVLGAGAVGGIYALLRSRTGLALTAIRDSEVASRSLGVDVRRVKFGVYVVSAFGCGAVGALIYLTKLRVSPDAAFDINWTVVMIFTVVIGGIGTIEGPILGCLIYFLLRDLLADYGSWYLIALGLVAIAVMVRAPRGLWGLLLARYDLRFFPVQRRVQRKEEAAASAER
jgi:branched-chain amino acid transport system permease protein